MRLHTNNINRELRFHEHECLERETNPEAILKIYGHIFHHYSSNRTLLLLWLNKILFLAGTMICSAHLPFYWGYHSFLLFNGPPRCFETFPHIGDLPSKTSFIGEKARERLLKEALFCIPPTIFLTNPLMSTVSMWPITSRGLLSVVQTYNNIILFSRNCQVDMVFSSDIIIEQNKTFLLFLLLQQTRTRQTQTTRNLSCLLLEVYDKKWLSFVWIHKTFGLTSSNTMVTKNRTVAHLRHE